MSFASDYIAQLERFAERAPLPRIRALHLPPARPDSEGKGEFCALELADGSLGLSYVLLDDTLERLRGEAKTGGLAGTDALEVARHYAEGSHDVVLLTPPPPSPQPSGPSSILRAG